MATFKQRESGWWQAVIRRKGHTQESKTFPSRADAEKWARDVESKIDKGTFVSLAEAEATTLYDALDRYEREVSKGKKGHGQEKYRIQSWQANALAMRSLASLRGADFAKYRDERLSVGAAAATVRLDLALISHVFTIASKEWNIPVQNPVANIRLPRQNNARERRLSEEEFCCLLDHLDGDIWEVRTKLENRIARVLFVVDGAVMILLHGFIKKDMKTPKQDLDLAKDRLKRIKGKK